MGEFHFLDWSIRPHFLSFILASPSSKAMEAMRKECNEDEGIKDRHT